MCRGVLMSKNPEFSRDSDYYAARAIEERRLAMASADQKVRAIHLEMAEKYDALPQSGDGEAQEVIGERQQAELDDQRRA